MIKKVRGQVLLTEHVEDPEDLKLQKHLDQVDGGLVTQLILYLCGVAIFYSLLHLVYPSSWPVFEMISTALGAVALLSKTATYRLIGWFLIVVSILGAIVALSR
jgi:hypothetical protein